MDYAVSTRSLSKVYKETSVVSGVNLDVPKGSVYGFLGPNGAGKTTTMKMILGLVRPTQGSINVLGTPMSEKNRINVLKSVGSLIESPSYYGNLTAYENLDIIRQLRELPPTSITEALNLVRLDPKSTKRVKHFSLGMKQRLGIAAALLGKPQVLLLDEPTNGLDPAGIQEIREVIKTLPQAFGMTVLVSSHLLSEIDQMADYVGIISHGTMRFDGSLENLHAKAQSWITLKTTDNAQAFHLLKNEFSGSQVQISDSPNESGSDLILQTVDDSSVLHATHTLSSNDIGLLRVEEHHENLESIFLEMTGSEASL